MEKNECRYPAVLRVLYVPGGIRRSYAPRSTEPLHSVYQVSLYFLCLPRASHIITHLIIPHVIIPFVLRTNAAPQHEISSSYYVTLSFV